MNLSDNAHGAPAAAPLARQRPVAALASPVLAFWLAFLVAAIGVVCRFTGPQFQGNPFLWLAQACLMFPAVTFSVVWGLRRWQARRKPAAPGGWLKLAGLVVLAYLLISIISEAGFVFGLAQSYRDILIGFVGAYIMLAIYATAEFVVFFVLFCALHVAATRWPQRWQQSPLPSLRWRVAMPVLWIALVAAMGAKPYLDDQEKKLQTAAVREAFRIGAFIQSEPSLDLTDPPVRTRIVEQLQQKLRYPVTGVAQDRLVEEAAPCPRKRCTPSVPTATSKPSRAHCTTCPALPR